MTLLRNVSIGNVNGGGATCKTIENVTWMCALVLVFKTLHSKLSTTLTGPTEVPVVDAAPLCLVLRATRGVNNARAVAGGAFLAHRRGRAL